MTEEENGKHVFWEQGRTGGGGQLNYMHNCFRFPLPNMKAGQPASHSPGEDPISDD